jgi:FtsH-binding integral membrane protein
MTIFGYVTKQDLSKIGSILFMALIGLIICMLVNIFLKSSAMDWLISFAGVAIFVGLTAWDTQKVKRMAEMSDETAVSKLATIGALQLYLDFINMFLYLLRIFGRNS